LVLEAQKQLQGFVFAMKTATALQTLTSFWSAGG
jgi:hypothetical protein